MADKPEIKDIEAIFEAIKSYGLSLPEAWEDHPWGETALKVRKKAFVFMGHTKSGGIALSMKLPRSAEFALLHPFTEPTGYGLGPSGWVTAKFNDGDGIPDDMLKEWVLQSYCAIAPKKLSTGLEEDYWASP